VFKTKAGHAEKALKALGYQVKINETKPLKGSFVITVNDSKIVELLDLQRPFKALREMDVPEVVTAALSGKK